MIDVINKRCIFEGCNKQPTFYILSETKGLEPTINKKFRRIFRNAGYEKYLINEFRTSKLCNCCHNELEKFMERPSKKPKTEDKVYFLFTQT